jgi:hypothetical protein
MKCRALKHDILTENWDIAYTNLNGVHVVGYKRLFNNIKGKDKVSEVVLRVMRK